MAHAQRERYSLWFPAAVCLFLLIVQIYFLLHDISALQWGADFKQRSGRPLATLKTVENDVRHRFGGTISWGNPQMDQALLQNDAIATMSGSQATLVFPDESELVLESDTLIILEEAPTQDVVGSGKSSGRIVARLIRGSITRKKSGKAPLLIRLSDHPDAPLHRFDDVHGDAVFKITVRAHGIEVTVESGSVVVDEKRTLTPNKLPAPVLKKPKIQITPGENPGEKKSDLEKFWDAVWIPSASAAPPSPKVTIQFAWEPTEGAQSYDLQISRDSEFKEITFEKRIEQAEYGYSTDPPQQPSELFFRVAAVDSTGQRGEFSSVEVIKIQPMESDLEAPKKPQIPQIKPPPTPQKIKLKTETSSHTSPPPAPPSEIKKFSASISFGPAFHLRTFQKVPAVETFSGSGILPVSTYGEIAFFEKLYLGSIYFPEVAQVTNAGSRTSDLSIPWIRSWITAPIPWSPSFTHRRRWIFVGASLSTSNLFSWSAAELNTELNYLAGPMLEIRPFTWVKLQGSWLPQSNYGGWESLLSFFYPLPFKKIRGIFAQSTLTGRWIKIEKSYSAGAGLGYEF